MRPIKFRAWDKRNQEMTDFSSMPFYITDIEVSWDKFDFMQFTGLKDKNGKEIYEGDIVQRNIHREGVNPHYITSEVAFIKGAFGTKIDDDLVDNLDLVHMSRYEVIGNIFENPELLEQHQD